MALASLGAPIHGHFGKQDVRTASSSMDNIVALLNDTRETSARGVPHYMSNEHAFAVALFCSMRQRDLLLPLSLTQTTYLSLCQNDSQYYRKYVLPSDLLTKILLSATSIHNPKSSTALRVQALETIFKNTHGQLIDELSKALTSTLMPPENRRLWEHPYIRCVIALAMRFQDPIEYIRKIFGVVARDDERKLTHVLDRLEEKEEREELEAEEHLIPCVLVATVLAHAFVGRKPEFG